MGIDLLKIQLYIALLGIYPRDASSYYTETYSIMSIADLVIETRRCAGHSDIWWFEL